MAGVSSDALQIHLRAGVAGVSVSLAVASASRFLQCTDVANDDCGRGSALLGIGNPCFSSPPGSQDPCVEVRHRYRTRCFAVSTPAPKYRRIHGKQPHLCLTAVFFTSAPVVASDVRIAGEKP